MALIISFITLSGSSISALKDVSGTRYPLSLVTIALGGIAANVLNLYSASLSGLVGGIKISRTRFVGSGLKNNTFARMITKSAPNT